MSDHSYAAAWKRYRRLRLHVWVASAGFVFSGAAMVFTELPSRFGWTSYIPWAFWLYCAVAISRFKPFRCPRCNEEIERRWPSKKYPDWNTCPHCGLRKFSDGE
jgi:predicted RNA-binding Zn-ribbon protein involved in translation (DUF1610 family)